MTTLAEELTPVHPDPEIDLDSIDPAEWDAIRESLAADAAADPDGLALTLEDWMRTEAAWYRQLGTAAGELMARTIGDLADMVKASGARTVADFEARDELLAEWHRSQAAALVDRTHDRWAALYSLPSRVPMDERQLTACFEACDDAERAYVGARSMHRSLS